MEEFEWRYRTRRDGPLSEPVTVQLTEIEAAQMRALGARMRALPDGPERAAILNEITTFMDLRAIFPEAQAQFEPASVPLPSPDRNTVGKFHGPAAGAPPTERQAAILVYPNTGTARRRVLDFIAAQGSQGATDEELSLALQLRLYTAAPRRNELLNDGWIRDSGRTRSTTTGASASVWVLSTDGSEQWKTT